MPDRTPIDRGIIFSAPMVRAILAGRKTQTRRLATSPLADLEPGDRLWLRENYRLDIAYDGCKAREVDPAAFVWWEADGASVGGGVIGKLRPSIFLPRWASRATLTVEAKRIEPLDQITEADAMAEGITMENLIVGSHCAGGRHSEITADRYFSPHDPDDTEGYECAVDAFAALWDSLHDREGERFAEAPSIVALTFAATLANIDSPAP